MAVPNLNAAEIEKAFTDALTSLKAAVERKCNEPLRVATFSTDEEQTLQEFPGALERVATYNTAIKRCNQQIQTFKEVWRKRTRNG